MNHDKKTKSDNFSADNTGSFFCEGKTQKKESSKTEKKKWYSFFSKVSFRPSLQSDVEFFVNLRLFEVAVYVVAIKLMFVYWG